mgnify:FL=1
MNDETTKAAIIHAALVDAEIALERCAKETNRTRRANIAEAWRKKHEQLITDLAAEVYETD